LDIRFGAESTFDAVTEVVVTVTDDDHLHSLVRLALNTLDCFDEIPKPLRVVRTDDDRNLHVLARATPAGSRN
jgi:hypothetical protein